MSLQLPELYGNEKFKIPTKIKTHLFFAGEILYPYYFSDGCRRQQFSQYGNVSLVNFTKQSPLTKRHFDKIE